VRPDGRFAHAAYLFFSFVVFVIVVIRVGDVEIGQPQLALRRSQAAHD